MTIPNLNVEVAGINPISLEISVPQGADGLVFALDKPTLAVLAATDGSSPVLTDAIFNASILRGKNNDTANWTIGTALVGCTGSLVNNTTYVTFTVATMTSDTATVTFSATREGFATLSVVATLVKVKQFDAAAAVTAHEAAYSHGNIPTAAGKAAADGATATPTANKVPIADTLGKVNAWVTPANFSLRPGSASDYRKFLALGGTMVGSTTWGAMDQAFRIPIYFTGSLAVTIRAKIMNMHGTAYGTSGLPLFGLTDGVGSTLKSFLKLARAARSTPVASFSVPRAAATLINYFPTNASASTVSPPSQHHTVYMVGSPAFTIQFTGDTSLAANQDLVLQLTSTLLRIYHSSDDTTVFSVTLADYSDSVASLCTYLAANLPSDYTLTQYMNQGSISELCEFTYGKLVQNKTNTSSVVFYTNYPVAVEYNDNTEHEYTIVMDASKNWYKFFCDGNETHVPVSGLSSILTALIGTYIYLNVNCQNLSTGAYTGAVGTQHVYITGVKVDTDIDKWLGISHLIVTMHSLISSTTESATGIVTSTTRLRRFLSAAKDNGYKFITAREFTAYMEGKLELPKKTILLTCDDSLAQSHWTTSAFKKIFQAYDAPVTNVAILDGTQTQAQVLAMQTGGWELAVHDVDYTQKLNDKTYAEMQTEIDNVKSALATLGYSTTLWGPSGGYCDGDVCSLMRLNGFRNFRIGSGGTYYNNCTYGTVQPMKSIELDDVTTWSTLLGYLTQAETSLA